MSAKIRCSLVIGQVTSGKHDGEFWIAPAGFGSSFLVESFELGVEGDDSRYDRLVGPLSGTVTHALVIGDATVLRRLVTLIEDRLAEESE